MLSTNFVSHAACNPSWLESVDRIPELSSGLPGPSTGDHSCSAPLCGWLPAHLSQAPLRATRTCRTTSKLSSRLCLTTGKSMSRALRKHLVSSLRSFLRFAHVKGYLERNLFEAVPIVTIRKLDRFSSVVGHYDDLT